MDWCDPDETQTDTKDYLNDVTEVTSKLTGVKFKKLPGNINYSTFPPGWTKLCNIHRRCVKLKLFSLASCFTGRVFTRELSGVDSQTATKSRKQQIYFISSLTFLPTTIPYELKKDKWFMSKFGWLKLFIPCWDQIWQSRHLLLVIKYSVNS